MCLRPGLNTATRNGYFVEKATPATEVANASYDLETAAETSIPLNGLHVTVQPGTAAGSYLVHVSALDLTWKAKPDGAATASVYVMAVALDGNNKMLAHVVHPMTANAPPDTPLSNAARTADFPISAPPADKAAMLRFVGTGLNQRTNRFGRSAAQGSVNKPRAVGPNASASGTWTPE